MNNKLSHEDILQIAKIHKKELKNSGFLGQCSIKFISFFYEKVSIYDSSIILVKKNNQGKVIGFCFFSKNINKYYKKFFKRNLLRTVFYISIYIPFIRSYFRIKNLKRSHNHKIELVQIAVDSKCQGRGIATELIKRGERELLKEGIFEYYLQVYNFNKKALRLYKKIGFDIIEKFEVNNKMKYLMKKSLK